MGNVHNIFDHTEEEPMVPIKSYKIGRNDPCPCGSGKKYKKCCDTIRPKHPIEYYVEALGKEKDHEKMSHLLMEAEKDYPMEPAFFLPVTAHYMQMEQIDKALANLRKAWAVMGSDLEDVFIYTLVTLLLDHEEYFEACDVIAEALSEKKETPELIMASCETLKVSNDYDEIFSMLDNALEKYPNNLDLLFCKMESCMDAGKPILALQLWKDNFALFSNFNDFPIIGFLRSRMKDAFGLADDAHEEQVKQAIDKLMKVFSLIEQFGNPTNQEQFADVKELVKKVQNMVIPSSRIQLILLETYTNLEEYATVVELSKNIETHFTDNALFYTFYSNASLEMDDFDTALEQIERAFTLALDEEEFDEWDTLALYIKILLMKNDPSALESLLNHVPELTSEDDTVLSLLETTLKDAGFEPLIDELLQQLKKLPTLIEPKDLYVTILYRLLIQFENGKLENNSQLLSETITTIKQELAGAEQAMLTSPVIHFAKIRIGLIEEAATDSELETLLAIPSEYFTEVIIKYEAILLFGDPQLLLDNPPDLHLIDEVSLDYHQLMANIILGNWEQAQESLLLTLLEQASDNNFYDFLLHFLNYIDKERLFKVIDLLEFEETATQKLKDMVDSYCIKFGHE